MKAVIIVPCYNEEEVLKYTFDKLTEVVEKLITDGKISNESRVCFVDDGSRDKTWEILENASQAHEKFMAVKLAQNAGHQGALLAGMNHCIDNFDCFISIDADLQDDPMVICEFIDEFKNGKEIVYGVRNDRTTDSFFKRTTAQVFYKLMLAMGVNLVYNHADYRLASQKATRDLLRFKEYNLFLRAIFPMLSKNSAMVYYKRDVRLAGESKYPLRKMINFALNGITSFSITPLRLITLVGVLFCLSSIALFAWIIVAWLNGATIAGWTSVTTLVLFIGSIQIISIGVVAEYIGKIYLETKERPKFIIETATDK